ncbi:MAG: hypothetical protein GY822_12345 [Deltaproteobacteria bacterium]|nr:hypothetical protein [Deltaproteobacteria bacterium]
MATVHQLMLALFENVSLQKFGPLDDQRLFAIGISSGGYMTSRMAVSYPGRFVALAIVAGGHATCSGPICNLPDALPRDHPPTVFLHGKQDVVVPAESMRR